MSQYVLQSTKPNGPTFEIIKYDPETKTGVLRGSMGVDFAHDMSKEHLQKNGYKVVPKPTPPAQLSLPGVDDEE